jgi:GTP:adenosylcobinamide-phosphate guanylyltransferase
MAVVPAVVLAAGGKKDKLALAEGVADKAMLPAGGRPMIDWVLDALAAAQRVGEVTVVADEGSPLNDHLAGRVRVATPQGPTFFDSIEAGMAAYADQPRVLVCTGDIPLATGEHIDEFLGRCELEPSAELCYSMIRASVCEQQLPGGRRTTVKLREGVFTGGNIVTMSPAFLVREKQRFAEVFALRKSPLKLCRLLGWGFVIKLVLGRASVPALVNRAKALLNCDLAAIESPYASIGFDVDKPEDLAMVRGKLDGEGGG